MLPSRAQHLTSSGHQTLLCVTLGKRPGTPGTPLTARTEGASAVWSVRPLCRWRRARRSQPWTFGVTGWDVFSTPRQAHGLDDTWGRDGRVIPKFLLPLSPRAAGQWALGRAGLTPHGCPMCSPFCSGALGQGAERGGGAGALRARPTSPQAEPLPHATTRVPQSSQPQAPGLWYGATACPRDSRAALGSRRGRDLGECHKNQPSRPAALPRPPAPGPAPLGESHRGSACPPCPPVPALGLGQPCPWAHGVTVLGPASTPSGLPGV